MGVGFLRGVTNDSLIFKARWLSQRHSNAPLNRAAFSITCCQSARRFRSFSNDRATTVAEMIASISTVTSVPLLISAATNARTMSIIYSSNPRASALQYAINAATLGDAATAIFANACASV
jgi:hypothetical protein